MKTSEILPMICVLAMIFLIISAVTHYVTKEDEKEYKYTMWIGSPGFGAGYYTDTFNIDNGLVRFVDSNGKSKIHPTTSVYEIEEKFKTK